MLASIQAKLPQAEETAQSRLGATGTANAYLASTALLNRAVPTFGTVVQLISSAGPVRPLPRC